MSEGLRCGSSQKQSEAPRSFVSEGLRCGSRWQSACAVAVTCSALRSSSTQRKPLLFRSTSRKM